MAYTITTQFAAIASEIAQSKIGISDALNNKGVEALPTESYNELIEKINNIQINPITITGGEIYPSTLYGDHIFDLFKVAENIRNTYGQFAGFILAQYYKGYDTIALSGADAYLCCDDFDNVIIGSTVHTWNDADNDMLDRWVAYLYYSDNYSFTSTTDGLCPRTILISGNCASINIDYNRLTALYIPDNIGTLGTFNLNTAHTPGGAWNKIQLIKNYPENNGTYFFYLASGVVAIEFSDLKSIVSCPGLIVGNASNMSALEVVSFPELETIEDSILLTTLGQLDFANVYAIQFPKLVSSVNSSVASCGNNYILGSTLLKEIRFPHLSLLQNTYTSGNHPLYFFKGTIPNGITNLFFDELEETSFYSGNGLNGIAIYCNGLEYIYFGYKDNDRTKSVRAKVQSCPNLVNIELKDGYLKNFDCHDCTALTETNIVNNILNKLGVNQLFIDNPIDDNKLTLTLGATNLAKLTAEEMQIAIDKGFTLA